MNTAERIANCYFIRLDDGKWEYTVLPLMKTRIINDEQKQDWCRMLVVNDRASLLMSTGFLFASAFKPLLTWLALTLAARFNLGTDILNIVYLAVLPIVVLTIIAIWPMPAAHRALKYKGLIKTAKRGRRVSWSEFMVRLGTALGPVPIRVLLALTATYIVGTALLSSLISELYLSDVAGIVLFCLLLGPAIPAGLKSKQSDNLGKSV